MVRNHEHPWAIHLTAAVLAGLLLLPAAAWGQETAGGDPAQGQATTEADVDDTATNAPGNEPVAGAVTQGETGEADAATAGEATPAGQPVEEQAAATDEQTPAETPTDTAADDGAPTTEETAGGTAGGTAGETAVEDGGGVNPLVLAVIVLAIFVLPVLAGNKLAERWKMPDHGWKISLTLFLLASSLVIVTFAALFDGFKFGPDLAGGITLIYEVADPTTIAEEGATDVSPGQVDLDELIAALKQRVDPTSTREVTIRKYGPAAVEIIIPAQGRDALNYVKRRITDLGQLEFRITADSRRAEDKPEIERALLLPPSQKDVYIGENKVAEWVAYAQEEFGPPDQSDDRGIVKRMAGDTPEALVLIDPWNVTGDYLRSASKGIDNQGAGPAVDFSFNSAGAARFRQLTSQNLPNQATGSFRYLGIILDKRLLSAPRINETITDRGQISGGSMNDEEVEFTVGILDAGRLPAALNKIPVRESVISPTLGKLTVEKGETAIVVSLTAVVVFMLIYYRFAGIVACLALTFNLLLVLALMVLIQAAFTLPGLAGLVLTVGMSVDANVLIYERIREELRSGAALRMAVRNGFGRAMSAIVDSNVTTIITGIVLYRLGTDQVKGFSVTLILGILCSMFTAIFFARLVFDVAERRGWVKALKMMHILTETNYDFLRVRYVAAAVSIVFVAIGLAAVFGRGSQLLDIDFTGGSSVTFVLDSDSRMPYNEVQAQLRATELADKNLQVLEQEHVQAALENGEGTSTVRNEMDQTTYSVVSSEESVDAVREILISKFGPKLLTYSFQIGELRPYEEAGFSGTEATLAINEGKEFGPDDGINHDALQEWFRDMLERSGHEEVQPVLDNPNYSPGSQVRFKEWTVRLLGLDEATARSVLDQLKQEMENEPIFPLANTIGGRVSGKMQTQALMAIFVSLLGVTGYLWLRFQKVTYGLAATVALIHDVLVTIGFLALSYYLVEFVPRLASALQIESFQISLTIVAALLTIMGYSLNDTIVTFDRLREVKGKSPQITPDMVNLSVNQTLSRTLLTSLTSLLVVFILFFFGGSGIHSFAFAYLVGLIAGTYSTIYIANPVLLWLSGGSPGEGQAQEAVAVERAG